MADARGGAVPRTIADLIALYEAARADSARAEHPVAPFCPICRAIGAAHDRIARAMEVAGVRAVRVGSTIHAIRDGCLIAVETAGVPDAAGFAVGG